MPASDGPDESPIPPRMTTANTMPTHSNASGGMTALTANSIPADAAASPATPPSMPEPAVVHAECGGDRPVLGEGAQRPAENVRSAPRRCRDARTTADAEREQRRDREGEAADVSARSRTG